MSLTITLAFAPGGVLVGPQSPPGISPGLSKQTEVDFGPLAIDTKTFNITDPDILSTSRVMATTSTDTPTNKDQDELEFDNIVWSTVTTGDGAFNLIGIVVDQGYVTDKFKVNYIIR